MSSILNQNANPSDYIDSRKDSPEVSDASLLESIAENDEFALGSLYERQSLGIFNYLVRLVKDQEVAEDLLQETYVSVWQGANQFKGRSSVKTWMFRIAHNKAISWLRKMNRLVFQEDQPAFLTDDNPELRAIASWQTEQLLMAINELSTEHRSVIELAFVQDLSYSEIAQIVDCPVGTVKSRVSYALRHLDGLLRQRGIDR